MNNLWETICYDLNGTCKQLHEALEEHEAEYLEDHMPFLDFLDGEIFRCACCGWWSGVSEMSDIEEDTVCMDCAESWD